MGRPVRATQKLTDRDRGLGETGEADLLRLLRLQFSDPDDPRLAERRQRLVAIAERFPLDRAGALHTRLSRRQPADELSTRFWRLSAGARQEVLDALAHRAAVHRQTQRSTSATAPSKRRCGPHPGYILVNPTDVTDYPDFIDNRMQAINRLLLTPDYYAIWTVNGKRREVWVRPQMISDKKSHTPFPFDVFGTRMAALVALTTYFARCPERARPGTVAVAFHRDPSGVILPTTFTPDLTPRFFAAKTAFDIRMPLAAQEKGYLTMLEGFADLINPLPGRTKALKVLLPPLVDPDDDMPSDDAAIRLELDADRGALEAATRAWFTKRNVAVISDGE